MKQFTLKSLLLVLTILMGGVNAWGEVKTITLENIGNSLTSTSNTEIKQTTISSKEDGSDYVLNYLQGKKQGSSILLAKSTGAFISNNTPIPGMIKSVKVFINSNASSKTTYHCAFNTVECTEAFTTGSTAQNIAAGQSYVFTCANEGAQYFCISLGNANNGQVLSIEINYEASNAPILSAPAFSLPSGDYWTKQTLELTTKVEGGKILYTKDDTDPTTSETAEEYSAPIEISETTTVKACVKDTEGNFSAVAERTYTFPVVFSSLEELVDSDLTSGTLVTVSFTDMSITNIYVTSSGYRNGVYLDIQKDGKDIEIYCKDVPVEWKEEDKLTGTITGQWKLYNGVWEIVPVEGWTWEDLTYKASALKEEASIDLEGKTSLLIGETDVYTVTYSGDGALSVVSSDPSVATATIEGSTVTITPVAKGKTTITVSAPSTENYYAIEKSYDLYVSAPLIPAASGYESVDFTKIEPYVSLSSGSVNVEDYQGQSFKMVFAKPQSTNTPTKYYYSGKAVRAYTGNTITITAAEEIVAVKVNYVSGYVDTGEKVSGLGTKEVVITSSKTCRFTSIDVYYRGSSLLATDGTANYATFSSDKDVEFVDATVYAVNVENGVLQLNEVTSKQVPAKTGVLLKSEKETAPYFYIDKAAKIEDNLLKPASLAMSGDYTFYKLAYDDYDAKTGLGFYWGADKGGTFTVKAGTAYLAVPVSNTASVKGFLLDGTPTAIEGVEAENNTDVIYNLSGQRVQKAQRGLYIVNGKKLMVK